MHTQALQFRRNAAISLAFSAVILLHAVSSGAGVESEDPCRGVVLLSSDIGNATSIAEIQSFVRTCRIDTVVIDYAWITYHWDQTSSQAVSDLIGLLQQDGVDVAVMYRPRTLDPSIPGLRYAVDENGQIPPSHNDLCFADEGSKQWGAGWGTRILQAFPSIDKIIIYNLLPSCHCTQCRTRGADYYNAQFLAFCRSQWRQVRSGVRIGHVGVAMEYAAQVDFFCPFLCVNREGNAPLDLSPAIASLVAMRSNAGGKPVVPLAKTDWAGQTNNTTQDIISAIRKCEEASLGFLLWHYGWIFHPDDQRYSPAELVEALGGNWQDVSRWYNLNPPQSWIYFESRESSTGQPPQLLLHLDTRQLSVPVTRDTVLISYLPDRVWSFFPRLAISMNDTNRVLLWFQLPALDPGSTLQKAEVLLDMKNSTIPVVRPFDLSVHAVTDPWDENNTCWNNQPASLAEPSLTTKVGLPPALVRLDITDMTRQWYAGTRPNYGLLLKVAHLAEPSPDLPFPTEEMQTEPLPWPHQRSGLSQAEIDRLNREVWVINDALLYQADADGSWRYFHGGWDIVLDNGTRIYAMKDGWVKAIYYSSIVIADDQGTSPCFGWEYTHLGNHQVKVGDFVTRGTFIGEVDFAGLAHIHLGKVFSAAPYWGSWHYLCLPNGHFTYVDTEAPVIRRPFYFLRNNSDALIQPGAGGSVTLSGAVDIVVAIRDPGFYARSRESGFGDRLTPARIEYTIAPAGSQARHHFQSFDFRKLRIKRGVNARDYGTEQTKVVYQHWTLFESSGPGDKSFSYYIITNCPGDEPPVQLRPGDRDYSWNTALTDGQGQRVFPDGGYDIAVTAYDFTGNKSVETMRVRVANGP